MRLRVKIGVNMSDLLHAIHHCAGEVLFHSTDGDVLNLKSELCRYLFVFKVSNQDFVCSGRIECENPNDIPLLNDYLEEGEDMLV